LLAKPYAGRCPDPSEGFSKRDDIDPQQSQSAIRSNMLPGAVTPRESIPVGVDRNIVSKE
jgi:hypothetical protein